MTTPKRDIVWIGPKSADGRRPSIRRDLHGTVSVSAISDLDSPSVADSVLELRHVAGDRYEVMSEILLTASGPAQVATDAYRDGWSRIFGKAEVGQA